MKTKWTDWISLGMLVMVLIGACTPSLFWRSLLLALAILIALAIVIVTAAGIAAGGKHD